MTVGAVYWLIRGDDGESEIARMFWPNGPVVGAVEEKCRDLLSADEGDGPGLIGIDQSRKDRSCRSLGEGAEGVRAGNADEATER